MPDLRESFKNVRPATQCSRRDYVYHVNGRGARGVAEKLRGGFWWWAFGLSMLVKELHRSFASLRMTKESSVRARQEITCSVGPQWCHRVGVWHRCRVAKRWRER